MPHQHKMSLTPASLAALALSTLASGCALFEYSEQKPLQTAPGFLGRDPQFIAIKADRRMVYAKPKGAQQQTCAEPPPDVAQSFSDSLRATLAATAARENSVRDSAGNSTEDRARASADISIARDFATAICHRRMETLQNGRLKFPQLLLV